MIPKIIHYCWFGGNELNDLANNCISSWEKYCPDYTFKRWDETSFSISSNRYTQEAYSEKKWAFVTDYVRLYALYHYGGIYMDTDVELIKPLDNFLTNEAFSGFEDSKQIPTGIIASVKGHDFIKKLLEYYDTASFFNENGEINQVTNVKIITEIGLQNGFVPNNKKQTFCNMTFYPNDYFCPKDYSTGKINITKNTVCIHHFDGSWHTDIEKKHIEVERLLYNHFGKLGYIIFKFYKIPYKIKKILGID